MELPNISITKHFENLEDPRVLRTRRHPLISIIVLAVAGVICNCDSWVEIQEFAKTKKKFFEKFLSLPSGIPSHDTFGRVFSVLDAKAFQDCFVSWVRELIDLSQGKLIPGKTVAIDGKTVRGSHNQAVGKRAIHMVSAWVSDNSLVLGSVKTEAKSNEITAIPELLKLLLLDGCIVTIDAMGCQKEIISELVKKDADYCIAVKENQPRLYEGIKESFRLPLQTKVVETYETSEKSHGRTEKRKYTLLTDQEYLDYLNSEGDWKNLRSIGQVESKRTINGVTSKETRYYILSINQVKQFAEATRNHWGIENKLHWVLDVIFKEDQSRVRTGHSDQNFCILRHLALNLIKQNKSKGSIKTKRLKSGWDENFLVEVLTPKTL